MLEAKFIDEGDHFKLNIVMGKPGVQSKNNTRVTPVAIKVWASIYNLCYIN